MEKLMKSIKSMSSGKKSTNHAHIVTQTKTLDHYTKSKDHGKANEVYQVHVIREKINKSCIYSDPKQKP